jgi:hypothetical protein
MRFIALFFLGLVGFSGQQPAPVNAGQSNQQQARAIIDRMIATMGGPAYLNVHDSYTEGRYGRFHNQVQVGGALYFRYWQWPDKERFELTKERDIVQLFVGDVAYEVTYRGSSQLNPQKDDNVRLALQRRHYALETVLREWLNAPGTILLDEGATMAENRMAEKITIITKENNAATILVSQDTHLPVEKIFVTRDPQTRDRDEEIEIYDNWRMVQGVNTPYNITVMRNGAMVRESFVSSVSYNIHPPGEYFTPKLIRREGK